VKQAFPGKVIVAVICFMTALVLIYYALEPPLARHIAFADRIVVTNVLAKEIAASWGPEYAPSTRTITVTGEQMREIMDAMYSLKNVYANWYGVRQAPPMCEWRLQFYRGQTLLDTADFSGCYVVYGDVGSGRWMQYMDQTGALKELFAILPR
jgi:hypothetical protein